MIFKTFDSDKDTFSSKFGILGKSFEDIGNRFKKVSDELIATNDYTISNIANAWKNSSIKKDLSDKFIITKSDIEDKLKDLSVYEQNPSDILKDLQKINNASKLDPTAWQKYFDTLTEGEKWQEKFVQTNDLTKVSLDDVKNAQNAAKQSAIAYNNGLEQMTIGAKAANVALKGLALAGNMIAMWAISEVVSGIYQLATYSDTLADKAQEVGSAFKESESDISSYKDKIEELQNTINDSSSSYEDVTQARKDLMTIQNELIDKYGSEEGAIRNITDAIKGQSEALDDLTSKQYTKMVNDFNKTDFIGDVENFFTGKSNYQQMIDDMELSSISIDFSKNEDLNKYIKQLGGTEQFDSYGESKGVLELSGNLTDVYDKLLSIQEVAKDLGEEDYSQSLSKQVNKVDDLITKYQDAYNAYILNEKILTNDSAYADYFKSATDAYTAYQDTVEKNSIDSDDAKTKADEYAKTVSEAMQIAFENGDTGVLNYFRNLYPELQTEVNTWNFKAKITPTLDGGQSNPNYEKDLDSKMKEALSHFSNEQDILNFNPKASTDEAKKEAYNTLIDIKESEFQGDINALVDAAVSMYNLQTQGEQDFLDRISSKSNTSTSSGASNILGDIQNKVDTNVAKNWYDNLTPDEQNLANSEEFEKSLEKQKENLNNATLSAENYSAALDDVKKAQGDISDNETTISFSDTMTQLDDMKSKLSAVDQVYAKLFDEDASIGFDDYSSLYDTFKDIEGLDIGSYIEQLQEAGQDQEKVQSTIDSLVGTYVQLSSVLGTVTDSNESLIASMLEEQGVANASDIVHRALIENKINEYIETTNLTNATREEIQAFIDETNAAYGTSITIGDILTAKLNLNGTTINTASDIEQLIALANAAGESASKVAALKNLLANMNGSVDTTTAEGMRSEQLAIKTKEKIEGGTFFSSGVSDWQPLKAEDFITTPYSGGTSTKAAKDKAAKDASKGAKDAAKEAEDAAKKAAEEAEKALTDALSHIKNAIDELDKEDSDKFSNWSSRNQALADEMGMIPQEIAKQQELYDFYMSQGETTKAEEAANAIKDLQRNLKELANQKLENIKQFYSDIIDLIDSLKELKNAYIDLKEAKGLVANEVDYRELMAQSEQERQNYEKELTELQNQLQDNINNGYIEEGSEAWYEWQKELNGIKKSIIECKKEQVEWNNAIKKLPFDALEKYTILIQKATDRINGANDILEAKGLSQSVANINEQIMALNETMSVTVHNRKLIFDALHDGLSDSEYGWADLNEDQIQKVFDYINTDDPLGLHDYLTSLGVDMYQFAADGESSVWGYVQQLSTLNSKIQETEKSQIELNKSIRDMGVKSAEAYGKLIDKANADIDNKNTLWEARGMDKTIAHYTEALQGLDMSIGSASNKRYQDVAKIYANFADGINGWAQLDTAQIDKVMEFVNADNSQGLFEYLGSLGIDASQLDEFWELVEDIQSIDSDITSTKQKQIEFNKALQQMDISTYEKLNELVSKAKTELEGLKNLIESHGKNASDNLLSKQIENSMKSVDLSKSMIGTYRDYISSQLSDNVSGWAKLTQEQINKVFSYLDANDTDGLNKYFNSLGMSAGTLTEFWEVVNKISSEESNIFSEMTNQEKYFDEMLENRISQLDDIKEKLNKINDAKNKALELEKARFALIQAMNNRNVMTWDGNQMVWTQDSSAVSSATENLNNLEFQALIDSIEDATDSINELIKNMNLYDDNGNLLSNWKKILASAGTSVDDIVSNIIKTLSARGYNFTDPKFNSGNSVIDSKYKDLISTEDVIDMDLLNSLKSAQQQKTIDLKTYIPDYASIFAKAIQNMPTNNTTTQTTSITYQLNGDFIMPNIHDDAKLDDFIKDLNSLSSKAEQRINKI